MISCFLVERRNLRITHHPCTAEGCDCGGWDESIFDIVRPDTGEVIASDVFSMGNAPVGAMWWTEHTEKYRPTGPQDHSDFTDEQIQIRGAGAGLPDRHPSSTFRDGLHLHVKTPGGTWNIDSRASNCGLPWDFEHRCWVRHGEVPNITVDKDGLTCAAGAGSIQCGSYHGFLQNGELT